MTKKLKLIFNVERDLPIFLINLNTKIPILKSSPRSLNSVCQWELTHFTQ